jgi:hypothetical protein
MKIPILKFTSKLSITLLLLASALLLAPAANAQEGLSAEGKELYDQIKAASLTGGSAEVHGLLLKRDRGEMSFDGTFYFSAPVEGRVTTAVFIGQGEFRADAPPIKFEKENLKRLTGEENVLTDFKTAVLRFTDDTFELVGKNRQAGAVNEKAQKMAAELDTRMLKETGANLSARLTLSILNQEQPGFFFASFDGGRRGRFSYVLDYQNRIPVANFDINAGEKGLLFAYKGELFGNDVWLAFHALDDYRHNTAQYSDINDLIDITHYEMDLDLRNPTDKLKLATKLSAEVRQQNLRAISFVIGESLWEGEGMRVKKQMHLKSVRMGADELAAVQEDWEGGLTVFLPRPAQAGEKLVLEFQQEGDFIMDPDAIRDCYYPVSNETWYLRQGYLDRASFDLTFHHRKRYKVASVGLRVSEEPDPESKDDVVTKYRMEQPIALATFALGPFERHTETIKMEKGGELPIEFNSLPGSYTAIKEDFILAEMNNSIRYFSLLFGKYPYPTFGATFHPFGYGQGFASMLMIPPTDTADKYTYSFISHETSHQWWGDIVTWRSYRDQWLSEGFAEYSGLLYTALREKSMSGSDELIDQMRRSLKLPPRTLTGLGKGRLNDVGPLILGHRLSTNKTRGAYTVLIYNKGALVLRMLHFLLMNPANGDDKGFFDMMTDFVERHRNGFASTEDFRAVASEYFARSPIGQKYKLKDLNWFFNQWVFESELPAYQVEYQIQDQPDGSVVVSGNVLQENVPDDWFMPLPIVFFFTEKQWAAGTVYAFGPKTPFQIKLPARPKEIKLDPQRWILSDSTSIKSK